VSHSDQLDDSNMKRQKSMPKFVVKPHRRLRAMSAERKSGENIDWTTEDRAEEDTMNKDKNTVWVGMKEYKAATHKLPLNRSIRMKLPSLNK
jgi:hypothetical protein